MAIAIITVVLALCAFSFLIVVFVARIAHRTPKDPSKEIKGPMPKNHGGFGQSVHGGKS